MSASTKLSTAVKALCYLSKSYPKPRSSTQISMKTGANASKLRQLLSLLGKQQIVTSIKGTTGGFLLNRDPGEIDLQEIYCAIEDRKAFHLDVSKSEVQRVSEIAEFDNYFLELFSEIQVSIEDKMKVITLQDVMEKVGIQSYFNQK
jgi:Rrf2 family protein